MWDRRKLLHAAIVLVALCYKVTAGKAKQLDMAPDAVDDLYRGCREEAMKKLILSDVLQQERNNSEGFQRAWSVNDKCSEVIPGKLKEHTTALLAYTNGDVDFTKTFDSAVKTMGANASIYEEHFHFKSLHFLLMDSMTLRGPNECKTLYTIHDREYTAQSGSKMRFGGFIKVYSTFAELSKWEDLSGVLFNITSCFFVNLREKTCTEEKDTVLLSPAEVFTVEEVKQQIDDDNEYTEIVLKHASVTSMHNCYIFSRSPSAVSTQWLVLMPVALSLFFFNC